MFSRLLGTPDYSKYLQDSLFEINTDEMMQKVVEKKSLLISRIEKIQK